MKLRPLHSLTSEFLVPLGSSPYCYRHRKVIDIRYVKARHFLIVFFFRSTASVNAGFLVLFFRDGNWRDPETARGTGKSEMCGIFRRVELPALLASTDSE